MSFQVLVIGGREIDDHVHISDCVPLVEEAFVAAAEGKAALPTKYHYFGSCGLWFFMGGIVEPLEAMAIKWTSGTGLSKHLLRRFIRGSRGVCQAHEGRLRKALGVGH